MPDTDSALHMLLSLLKPHRRIAITLIVLGFLATVSEGIGIGLFIPFLQDMDPKIALGIFGAVLLKAALSMAVVVLFARLSARIGHELRAGIFDEVMTVDFQVLNRIGTGRMLNVLSNESWRTADAISTVLHAAVSVCTMIVYMALLLWISWKLTLVVAVLLVLLAVVVRLVTNKVGELGNEMTQTNAEVASKMVDGVGGVEVIRGHAQEDYENKRFNSLSERLARVTQRTGVLSGAIYPLYEVLAAAVLIIVLLTSVDNSADLAPMLVFLFVLYRLAPVVKRFEQERVELKAAEGAVRETFSIIEQDSRHYLDSGDVVLENIHDAITLEDVGYQYAPGTSPALHGVSARIPARGLTAVVGPSGAGKSTLMRLLLRFFDPTEGQIFVDGVPLTDLALDSWRRRIAVVPQKAFLFNGTVRENIAHGQPNVVEDEVIGAARAAGAHEFIAELSNGYDTKLGEEGIDLSGGEAQRVCLARALIRQPDLLLLDEATNALDRVSEDRIHSALETLKRECAIVAIAHRALTIRSADQVLDLGIRSSSD